MKRTLLILILLLFPAGARASFHYFILANPGNDKNVTAFMELGTDRAPQFRYTVWPGLDRFVPINENDFAITDDLFAMASSTPALVQAVTVDGQTPPQPVAAPSEAIVRQGKILMHVLPVEKAAGTQFAFPVGDLQRGAMLYIANPTINANDTEVVVSFSQTTPSQTITVPLGAAVQVPLTVPNSRITVSSPTGVAVIVQLAIIGKNFVEMTMIPSLDGL